MLEPSYKSQRPSQNGVSVLSVRSEVMELQTEMPKWYVEIKAARLGVAHEGTNAEHSKHYVSILSGAEGAMAVL